MWFVVAIFIAAFIVTAFFSPKPKVENARASALSDFSFPRANEGDPVPRLYGTVKFQSPNTIWAGDFKAVAIKKKVKTGLFSSKKQTIGYKYYIGMDLAVCLGPGFVFRRIWTGKYEIWNGCLYEGACETIFNVDLPELYGGQDKNGGVGGQIALYCGAFDQGRDSYLAAKVDPDVPAYVGIAHMVFRNFYWGNSTNILPVYIEGALFPNTLDLPSQKHIMPNGLDANPIAILHDLYTNNWGNLKVDPDLINVDQWREVALKVHDEGNGMSLIVANANSGADLSKEILRQINAIIFENPSTGLIDLKLIRQDYNIADLPVLGPSEVVTVRNFTKKLWDETYNRVRVKYTDRADSYKDSAIATAEDFANIRYQGNVRATDISMPGVYVAELAGQIAARELANLNVPLYQCELEINRKGVGVMPGDPFVFNWPEYGIAQMVMRMRKSDLGTLQDGTITATVVQDEFALDAVVISPPSRPVIPQDDFLPKKIATHVVFELPYFLDYNAGFATRAGYTRLAAFAVAPGAASLSYSAFMDDTPDDAEVLEDAPYSTTAKLAQPLAQFAGWTDGYIPTLTIKELTDDTALVDGDEASARSGHGLFMIGDELLSYETHTDNGDGTFTLNTVHRALLDTSWHAAMTDDPVYFFDGQEGFFESECLPGAQTVYLLDRTVLGVSDEAGADHVGITAVNRVGAPLPPDNLTINAARDPAAIFNAGDTVTVAWNPRNRLSADAIAFETDAVQSAETSTTYTFGVSTVDGIVLAPVDVAGATYDFAIPDEAGGAATISVYAVRNGVVSYAAGQSPMIIAVSDGSLTIDYDVIKIDGERIIF